MSRRKSEPHEAFIFEIKGWEPTYTLSVNHDRERPGDFVEYAEIELETICVLPEKQAGRKTHFILSGRRNYLVPPVQARMEETSVTKSVGLLDLSARGGSFYGGVPHESIAISMSGLTAGLFRYVMLSGPPLRYGTSAITHLHLMRSAEPDGDGTEPDDSSSIAGRTAR